MRRASQGVTKVNCGLRAMSHELASVLHPRIPEVERLRHVNLQKASHARRPLATLLEARSSKFAAQTSAREMGPIGTFAGDVLRSYFFTASNFSTPSPGGTESTHTPIPAFQDSQNPGRDR